MINASSVGMKTPDAMIINEQTIRPFSVIMDVVIYHAETKLLKTAKQTGKTITDFKFLKNVLEKRIYP